MIQKTESKWQTLQKFINGYLQENTNYRAGAIYEAYLNECDSADISRKDFEMFLRDQVIKDDGMLKRVSHGVYTMRSSPEDKGVFFSRVNKTNEISLDEILDNSVELMSKIKAVFQKLNNFDGVSFPAQMELKRLKELLTNSMDVSITHITAIMAWCEDNVYIQAQENDQTVKLI